MHRSLAAVALALTVVLPAWAAGPTVSFTLPAENEDKLLPIMDRWAQLKRELGA